MSVSRPVILFLGLMSSIGGARADNDHVPAKPSLPPLKLQIPEGDNLSLVANKLLTFLTNGQLAAAMDYRAKIETEAIDHDRCSDDLTAIVGLKSQHAKLIIAGKVVADFNEAYPGVRVYNPRQFNKNNHCVTHEHKVYLSDDAVFMAIKFIALLQTGDKQGAADFVNRIETEAKFPVACQNDIGLLKSFGDNPSAMVKTVGGSPVAIVMQKDGKDYTLLLDAFQEHTLCKHGDRIQSKESMEIAAGFVSKTLSDLAKRTGLPSVATFHDESAEHQFNKVWTEEAQKTAAKMPGCTKFMRESFQNIMEIALPEKPLDAPPKLQESIRRSAYEHVIETLGENYLASGGACGLVY